MNLKINAPDKKLTLTKMELQVFQHFIITQQTRAFTGIYNFKSVNREREELYTLIAASFAEKLINRLVLNYHKSLNTKIKVSVSAVEERTLVNCLLRRIQHLDDSPLTIAIIEGIIFQLKPLKAA